MNRGVLRRARKARGYKQHDIAQYMGVTNKTYSLKETGKRDFTRDEVLRVIKCLNLSFDEVNSIFFENTITLV